MGNTICNKCGINYNYYLEKGYTQYDRPSCRKCYDYEIKNGANYYHDRKIKWGFIK